MHLRIKNSVKKLNMFFLLNQSVLLYLVCVCVCVVLNAINIILEGRQGLLESDVWYSRRPVFSFIVVLLNFLKYRMILLFPKIVVSAFVGVVLYLCHDLNCLVTVSSVWYFCSNCSVIVSVGGKKMFSTSCFDRGIVSKGS